MARRVGRADDGPEAQHQVRAAVTSRRPPAWRSPRFGAGVVLVAASVALGSWAVDRAASGREMWVARHDLAPGATITPQDLRQVPVAWEGGADVYLAADDLPSDAVATSFVGAGELVPVTAIGVAADVDGRPVTVPVPAGVSLEPGVLVDLWAVPRLDDAPPTQLADGVLVLGTEEDPGVLRSGSGTVARVLVDVDAVADVLAAQADGGSVTLVERPGS